MYSKRFCPDAVITAIDKFLSEREEENENEEISRITKSNNEIVDKNYSGFLYDGYYYIDKKAQIITINKISLDPSLNDRMKSLVKTRDLIKTHRQKSRQIITKLLRHCHTIQDLRDALPDCLLPALPDLKHTERTREEGWPLLDGKHNEKEWDEIRPLISSLAISRMF